MYMAMRLWFVLLVSVCVIQATKPTAVGPTFPDISIDDSSVSQLIKNLTRHSYDKQVRPASADGNPLAVQCRVYIYFLKSHDASSLQFKVHMLLQLRWKDTRLRYSDVTNATEMIGVSWMLDYIWAPHIYFANERDSLVMRSTTDVKDQLINVLPDGDVYFATRLKTTMLCRMKQGKFPFDQQKCHLIMDSWRYNTSNVILQWELQDPVMIRHNNPSLAEYYLVTMNHHNSEEQYSDHHAMSNTHHSHSYSSVVLTFVLQREFGFYIMDYYVPSIILVILSWVSFWLEPDATPARCLLGVSTMLTFIMLKTGRKSSERKLHFKTNDIWFIGCTAFIFLSLVEFAFVNAIHRQVLNTIRLKKASSKNILRTALSPHMLRKRRCSSCPTSPIQLRRPQENSKENYLTVDNFHGLELSIQLKELGRKQAEAELSSVDETAETKEKTVMTTHEIARWIDQQSRKAFPTAFLIFNLFYWTFMFI